MGKGIKIQNNGQNQNKRIEDLGNPLKKQGTPISRKALSEKRSGRKRTGKASIKRRTATSLHKISDRNVKDRRRSGGKTSRTEREGDGKGE